LNVHFGNCGHAGEDEAFELCFDAYGVFKDNFDHLRVEFDYEGEFSQYPKNLTAVDTSLPSMTTSKLTIIDEVETLIKPLINNTAAIAKAEERKTWNTDLTKIAKMTKFEHFYL
jgi:hypothetical protein